MTMEPAHTGADPAHRVQVTLDDAGAVREVALLPGSADLTPEGLADAVLSGYDEAEIRRTLDPG